MQSIKPRVAGRLNKELKALSKNPPEGVRLVPNDMDTLSEIFVEIDGPEQTPYENGSFRVKLVLGQDYPQAPPRGFFLTKIYHPNVSNNGDICVNTLKKDWSESVTLSHILAVIRCLLIVPFPESSLNDEAGKLFMESYDDYAERARLMTQVHAMKVGGAAEEADPALLQSSGNEANIAQPSSKPKKAAAVTKAVKKQKENKKKSLKRL